MRARGAPNRHFNVAALENGKFIPGVGKINSGEGVSAAALPDQDRRKRRTKKARIPPVPPASMLSLGQAAATKNAVYFSKPQPLEIHGCPTLKQGGSGGPAPNLCRMMSSCRSLLWVSAAVYFSNTGPSFYESRVCLRHYVDQIPGTLHTGRGDRLDRLHASKNKFD